MPYQSKHMLDSFGQLHISKSLSCSLDGMKFIYTCIEYVLLTTSTLLLYVSLFFSPMRFHSPLRKPWRVVDIDISSVYPLPDSHLKFLFLAEAEGRFYVGIAMEQALLEDSWAHLMSSSMELEVEYVAVVRRSEHVGQFVFSLEWCVMDESDIFLAWNVILFFMELDSCGIFIKSKHGLSIFFVTS